MSKSRVFLAILVFLAVGYWLWHHLQQPAGSREFHLRPYKISNREKSRSSDDPNQEGRSQQGDEELTPYESLQLDMRTSYRRLHSPLEKDLKNESEILKRLWERSRKEHQHGNLTLEEAREISRKLTELIRMNDERQKLVVRMRQIERRTHARFESNSQLSDKERQEFARKALLRQWEEWKTNNRRRLQ
ncbi:MAG: hypothetical protein PF795_12165 [Kiritimatiellae bacterium]|nr:hypothetical protein [Kiritimatiellia bacterium]